MLVWELQNIFSSTQKKSPNSADTHFARSSNDLQKLQSEIIIRNTSVELGASKALHCVSNDILVHVSGCMCSYGPVKIRRRNTSYFAACAV